MINSLLTLKEDKERMPTALLIGLQYSGTRHIQGVVTDLHLMRKYWLGLGFRVIIVTDGVSAPNFSHTDSDHSILSFSSDHTIHALTELLSLLDLYTLDTHLVLYYTGHGTKEGWVLPSSQILPYNTVRRYMSRANKVLGIIDACNCGSLGLPLYLSPKGSFLLQPLEGIAPYPNEVLLLTATEGREEARSFSNGSVYTRSLIEELYAIREQRAKDALLCRLLKDIGYKVQDRCGGHTPMAYSSRVIYPILPTWIWSQYDIEVEDWGLRVKAVQSI